MRNASRARKMRNHLDQFKRSAMRLENGITIQTSKKTRRGIYLSLFVRVFPNAYLREMNEDFCKPKSHKSLPFFALCLWLIPFFGLPCLSFFIKLLLLTTLYISIAQIQYKWTLSLSLSLCVCACTATQKMISILLFTKIKRYRASTPTRCKSSRCNTPRSTDTAKPIWNHPSNWRLLSRAPWHRRKTRPILYLPSNRSRRTLASVSPRAR